MSAEYILAVDQGTTSSRAVVFDKAGRVCGMAQKEFEQIYPQPGWVEHNPMEILETEIFAMRRAVREAGLSSSDIAAIGITNQRETTIAWDARTGRPVYNAIVWQCRRTAEVCEQLADTEQAKMIHQATGLVIDPYFAGTKMQWILENVPEAAELAEQGHLRFGTVDTWLIWHFTGGKRYVTDVSNASRTMLFNIHTLQWDEELLALFGIPRTALPEVCPSSGILGKTDTAILGHAVPIAGIAGDQHAALFGQCCFTPGMAKNTYGTGCFVLMNTGEKPVLSEDGLLTTVAWQVRGKTTYALEGSAFNAGSAINWLRDGLKIIEEPAEADRMALSVSNSGGVTFVPAFTGLGAPYWDMYARGSILGITRGTTDAHICRAVLDSIALENCDLFYAMEKASGTAIRELRVDGGVSRSAPVMQYQADLLGCRVLRPKCLETTAMGAAMLAGLAVGLWADEAALGELWHPSTMFDPDPAFANREHDLARWHQAVERSRGWAKETEF